jgi:hypothetical protein
VGGDGATEYVKAEGEDEDEGTLYSGDLTTSQLDALNNKTLVGAYSQSGNEYTIYTAAGWDVFCDLLANNDKGIFDGKTVKLGADIEVTRMAGSGYHDFTGTFDGQGHTLTAIQAGVPYIVKWTPVDGYVNDDAYNIVNPVFTDIIVSNTTANVSTDCVDFVGTYSPTDIYTANKTNLYLGGGNTLYYPWADGLTEYYLNANRAYFHVDFTGSANVRSFVLNFGEGEPSSIENVKLKIENEVGAWYTLDGRKLDGVGAGPVPARLRKGLYIHEGKKVVIK